MDFRNCKKCGKLFTYTGNPLCPDCLGKEEDEFKLVKEFIYDNPKCSVYEVAEATGVAVRTIIGFLKQDRLESVEGMSDMLTCERCGAPIKSGKYCEKCMTDLKRETKKLLNDSEANVSRVTENSSSARDGRIYVNETRERRLHGDDN